MAPATPSKPAYQDSDEEELLSPSVIISPKKKSPHQGNKDYHQVLKLLRGTKIWDITGTLPSLEICKSLGWDSRYPDNGPWKNFISRVQKVVLAERMNNNTSRYADEQETEKVRQTTSEPLYFFLIKANNSIVFTA